MIVPPRAVATSGAAWVASDLDAGLTVRTRVDVDLHAYHTDPHNDPAINEGRHEHVWNVQAVFEGKPFRDGRSLRAAVATILEPYQGKDLPPELWAGEELAAMVLLAETVQTLGNVIGVVITRPGFVAEAWR